MPRSLNGFEKPAFFSLLFILASCSPNRVENTQEDEAATKVFASEKTAKLLGGDDVIAVIQKSDSVSAYLLPQSSYFEQTVDAYTTRLGPQNLSQLQETILLDILLSEESYLFDVAKGCEPDYGVRFEFRSGESRIDVLICFGCSQLQIYRNGKSLSGALFDPAAEDLAEAVKEIFPNDELMQSL